MTELKHQWQTLLITSIALLVAIYGTQYLSFEENLSTQAGLFMFAFKSLPLIIFTPFILRKRKLNSLLFSLLLFLYFAFSVLNAFQGGTLGMLAIAESLCIIALFSFSFILGKSESH